MLGGNYCDVTFPLMFITLSKKGNASEEERIILLDDLLNVSTACWSIGNLLEKTRWATSIRTASCLTES